MLDIYRPYKWSDGPYLLYREEWSKFLKSLTRKQKAAVNSDRFTHEDTIEASRNRVGVQYKLESLDGRSYNRLCARQ